MSEDGWAMTHLHLEKPHRPFNAMPVVVMLDVDDSRVRFFVNVPTAGPLLNGEPDKVAMRSEFAIDDH
jgi:hypothetical protein